MVQTSKIRHLSKCCCVWRKLLVYAGLQLFREVLYVQIMKTVRTRDEEVTKARRYHLAEQFSVT